MDRKPRCADCRYVFDSMAAPHGERINILRCRAMPPQISAYLPSAAFPDVSPDDHCGQFKAKEQ